MSTRTFPITHVYIPTSAGAQAQAFSRGRTRPCSASHLARLMRRPAEYPTQAGPRTLGALPQRPITPPYGQPRGRPRARADLGPSARLALFASHPATKPMSLSSHIKSKASPVRAWFETTLPETRGLATDANRALRGQGTDCPVPRVPGADPGLVGTAVDYLLRACLRVTSIEWTVASKAAQHLASSSRTAALDRVELREVPRPAPGHFPDQLVRRQRRWMELQNLAKDRRLLALVFVMGGDRGTIARALRVVVHGKGCLPVPCPRLFTQSGGRFCGYGGERRWDRWPDFKSWIDLSQTSPCPRACPTAIFGACCLLP